MAKVRFCPRCKSTNVEKEIQMMTVLGAPSQWKCNDCGFRGHIFPEVDTDELEKKRKKISKK